MDVTQALALERRSGIVTIRGRRFRISEPRPLVAGPLLTAAAKHISPLLMKILAGVFVLTKPAVCPSCGATEGAERVNGDRWLCQAQIDTSAGPRTCGTLWPREQQMREDGTPDTMTLGRALADPEMRGLIAASIHGSIEKIDPDDAHAFALRMIFAGTSWEPVAGGEWQPIADGKALEMALAQARIGGMGIMRLARAHLETWVLPSLVDDWTPTSPASSANATPGGSETREPERPPSAPSGRVVPRSPGRMG